MQVPLQQSGPAMQGPPFGVHWLHCAPQSCTASETQMLSQAPLQQNGSWAQTCWTHAPHCGPSATPSTQTSCGQGGGGGPHVPLLHEPLQHSAGLEHIEPFGEHMLQPQLCCASPTQMSSHATWQQKGSNWQITPAHALQAGLSLSPTSHCPWLQVATPQKPPSHTPVQHSKPFEQGTPSGWQGGVHVLFWQLPEQHSNESLQNPKSGTHGPPHTPCEQMPVQQSFGEAQSAPFGKQPSQMPPLHCRLQQSAGTLQSKPGGKHCCAHTPPWQLPVQHWFDTLQAPPCGTQPSTHTLPTHWVEQHCCGEVQAEPVCRQVPRQSPSGPQAPEQHSNGAPHGCP
jgi:hypothetical protein